MKKNILAIIFLLGITINTISQTIVSTAPQNKKIILEEFTGIHCTYCPDGHVRANAILTANPGNAFVINVHVGGYATPAAGEPDFRTPFGTAIAAQTALTGYPSGTVNRSVFTGAMTAGGTAMGRGNWLSASNQIKLQPSYVNVATTATIDVNTRLLTVHVESYYTADSPVPTNKLNVALVQNKTTGPQTGGGAGSNYNHQHRLVNMVTGQWGEDITTTTTGTFVDRTYTYTIPASYNAVPAVLGDFEIVAFVAEGQQKIISGNGCTPTYIGLVANDAKIFSVTAISDQCSTTVTPKMTIQNNGSTIINSLPITYNVNGSTNQTYTWTGNLTGLSRTTVTLPSYTYSVLSNNSLNISLPTDGDITNNNSTITFNKAPIGSSIVTVSILPDAYGSEISWNITNSVGAYVSWGGPYIDGDTTLITVPVNLPSDDCYAFNIIDSYGDGIGTGSNYVRLRDSNGTYLYNSNGLYGSGAIQNFSSNSLLATENFEINTVALYPNPSNGILKIQTTDSVDVSITDVTGKIVFTMKQVTNQSVINLTSLQSGIYFARIISGNKEKVEKIILN